jgi:hypothetical protein
VDTITGKSPDKLEEKLAMYRKLKNERDILAARLEKVENEKGSVDNRIFDKVRTEYSDMLENIRNSLEPVESEIADIRRRSEKELSDIEDQVRTLEDELAEAEFRTRVGEFSSERLSDIRTRLHPELAGKAERRRELQETLEKLKNPGGGNGTSANADETRASEELSDVIELAIGADSPEQTAETAETPDTEEAGENDHQQEPSFENPQNWIDELGEDRDAPETAAENPADETAVEQPEADDPLSELADPTDDKRKDVPEIGNEESEEPVCVGFPNLVIVTGHSSGKKIPLLPMTMSIGREHDNNIELKDPDVARYHARIMYERGHFVLEEMDSSNSTLVNGEPAKRATLKNGDRIKIGETEMVIDFD